MKKGIDALGPIRHSRHPLISACVTFSSPALISSLKQIKAPTTMIPRSIFAMAAAIVLSSAQLDAQVFNEVGDAGQTLGTAQFTGAFGTGLSAIVGTISSSTDADLYVIRITAPTTFSATTVNATTSIDTALFLFSSSGVPIVTNDDASGTSLQSSLPAGNSFTFSLAPGTYYLGISLSGNEPINLSSQLLFAGYPGGDPTALRGPASGVNPTTLANFNGQTSFPEVGAYRIDLTSTQAVPEPTTVALAIVGAAALLTARRRRANRAS